MRTPRHVSVCLRDERGVTAEVIVTVPVERGNLEREPFEVALEAARDALAGIREDVPF